MKSLKLKIFFPVLIGILLILPCKQSSNQVIVYCTVDQVFSEPILKDFEAQTGIKVKSVYNTEETKSTDVMNRLIAEKNNPQCDVSLQPFNEKLFAFIK